MILLTCVVDLPYQPPEKIAMQTAELNKLAFQSNALVRSKLNFTHVEARIFGLALGCIHKTDTELPPIKIDVADVVTSERGASQYEIIRTAILGLGKKTASIEGQSGKRKVFTVYSLIDTLTFDAGTGLITGAFANAITPFLLQLKDCFTKVEIESLLTLRSAHSHRLYWILKSWQEKGSCTIKVEALREMMLGEDCGDSYSVFHDFKRNVLIPAIKELHDLEPAWLVTFEEKKRGRSVDEILFAIPKQKAEPKEKKASASGPKKALTIDEIEQYRDWAQRCRGDQYLREYDKMQSIYKLTEYQARTVINSLNPDLTEDFKLLIKTLNEVKEDIRIKVPMKSVGAYTLAKLKTKFKRLFVETIKK